MSECLNRIVWLVRLWKGDVLQTCVSNTACSLTLCNIHLWPSDQWRSLKMHKWYIVWKLCHLIQKSVCLVHTWFCKYRTSSYSEFLQLYENKVAYNRLTKTESVVLIQDSLTFVVMTAICQSSLSWTRLYNIYVETEICKHSLCLYCMLVYFHGFLPERQKPTLVADEVVTDRSAGALLSLMNVVLVHHRWALQKTWG